jgi:transcriptional regulator with XRE-family HTH domain
MRLGRPPRLKADQELMDALGQRLLWVREAMGMSQVEIAELVGIHQVSWSQYERGIRWPHPEVAVRICAKLQLTVPYLLEGKLDGVEHELAIRALYRLHSVTANSQASPSDSALMKVTSYVNDSSRPATCQVFMA